MNAFRKIAMLLMLATVLVVGVIPALAETHICTVTFTEDEINQSYRVTNPARRILSNIVVDLQPGQAVISATVTLPRQSPVNVVATLTPYIENGRLFWTVTAVNQDGTAVSDDVLNQINTALTSSWQNYFRTTGTSGMVTNVEITDTEITITLTR
jgi:hypothetical protein